MFFAHVRERSHGCWPDYLVNRDDKKIQGPFEWPPNFEVITIHQVIWPNPGTARFVQDEKRNDDGNQNPEWWGDVSQLVKIDKIKSLGTLNLVQSRIEILIGLAGSERLL